MDKISFMIVGEEEPAEFYVLEQTRIGGFSYLLVTEEEDGDSQAWILKDLSADGEDQALYEIVEDDETLEALGAIFQELLSGEEV